MDGALRRARPDSLSGPAEGDRAERVAQARRREYPDAPEGPFFNAASWGLLPRGAADAVADLTLRRNRSHGFEEQEAGEIQRRCRQAVATLLAVDAREIALAPNTSFGVGLAAGSLVSRPAGRVLVSAGEFPANVLPWKPLERLGFEVEVVPLRSDGLPDDTELLSRLDRPDVRAVSVSAVQFASGYRMDLATLGAACRERGVLFCVDAIQAVGAVEFRPREVLADIVACGGQKWLCSPWGSGFVYVREGLIAEIDPPMVSWLGVRGGSRLEDMLHYDLDWRADARKFELATLGLQDYLGLAISAELFTEMGMDAVEAHIRAIRAPLDRWIDSRTDVRRVTPSAAGRSAGIVSFVPRSLVAVAERLRAGRTVFSVREGAIRFAPHFYNTVEEMERAITMMERA